MQVLYYYYYYNHELQILTPEERQSILPWIMIYMGLCEICLVDGESNSQSMFPLRQLDLYYKERPMLNSMQQVIQYWEGTNYVLCTINEKPRPP